MTTSAARSAVTASLGLGAIVEDPKGVLWVKIDDPPTVWAAARSHGERAASLDAIGSVTVLHPGMTAPAPAPTGSTAVYDTAVTAAQRAIATNNAPTAATTITLLAGYDHQRARADGLAADLGHAVARATDLERRLRERVEQDGEVYAPTPPAAAPPAVRPGEPSAWLDDPGQEPAAVRDIPTVCPRCGQPGQNPVPVLVPTANTAEALCACPSGHLFIVRWTDFDPTPESTPESEDPSPCG